MGHWQHWQPTPVESYFPQKIYGSKSFGPEGRPDRTLWTAQGFSNILIIILINSSTWATPGKFLPCDNECATVDPLALPATASTCRHPPRFPVRRDTGSKQPCFIVPCSCRQHRMELATILALCLNLPWPCPLLLAHTFWLSRKRRTIQHPSPARSLPAQQQQRWATQAPQQRQPAMTSIVGRGWPLQQR